MITSLAILCILLMTVSLSLHLFGLPANWLVFIFATLWTFFAPQAAMTWQVLAVLAALAVLGEVLETMMTAIWGKKYGGSNSGMIAGMIGALIGAILGAPILFGLGALFGALIGAFLGALAMELFKGRTSGESLRAAWGTMLGRFGGTVLKAAIGFAMVGISAPRIWAG